ncbi:hypothetical protein DFH09DRAFT_1160775 [Mycena vulgaris]|nr:hypothetical protein DFH09DRAFT_1160775 [Mycena vulgaris]
MADFNFIVCGIATIAATVGYACVRKVRPLPSRGALQHLDNLEDNSRPKEISRIFEEPVQEPDPSIDTHSDVELEPIADVGNSSLKRKRAHDQEESDPDMVEGYPHNLKSIYPNKRRSGSISEQDPNESTEKMTPEDCDPSTNEQPQILAAPSLPDPVSSAPPEPDLVEEILIPETPKPEPVPTEIPRFVFPQTPPRITQFPSTRSRASPGFANFAGSSSPFRAFGPSTASASIAGKPIWANTPGTAVPAVESPTPTVELEEKSDPLPALVAAKASSLVIQAQLTGEEEEDVTLELKGVKLFVKRGDDNFSGGMVGHIKLLSHRTNLSKRLLFRREPLWKVSMNVRMQPTVRCTFDVQENILRVALKELEDKPDSAPQTVIYAFKPSRSCRRGDFQDFAESLLAQARAGDQ